MSLQVIKQPLVNINGHLSKWNSVHQPIEFELERRDASSVYVKRINGYINIKLSSNVPNSVKVGHLITFVTKTKPRTVKITKINYPNVIITDSTEAVNFTVVPIIFAESYRNYFVETEIYGVDSYDTYVKIGTCRNTASPNGIVRLSIQEWLKTQAKFENDFQYNKINKAVFGEGGRFNIRYRENYNGVAGNYTELSTLNLFYWTNSVKQIQESYGQNMGDYVPTRDDTRVNKAKFQSVFKEPTYFEGYPFSMNFIYSDNLLNYQITRKERTYNVNNVLISETTDNVLMSQKQKANRLMLKQGYTSNIHKIELWLESGDVTVKESMSENAIFETGVFSITKPLDTIRVPIINIETFPL